MDSQDQKHNNRRAVRQWSAEGENHWVNSEDRNAPIRAVEKTSNHSRASCFIRLHMTSQPHHLKKTSSMQSKRCDLHYTWPHRETNIKLSFYCYSPQPQPFFIKVKIDCATCAVHQFSLGWQVNVGCTN